jgi:hypothetical protein
MDSDALMGGFRRCVDICNDGADRANSFAPWTVEGKVAGYLTPAMVTALSDYPDVFKARAAPEASGWQTFW